MRIAIVMAVLTALLAPAVPLSGAPVSRDETQLRRLAQKLEERALKALHRAESRRHRFTRSEAEAVNTLRRFAGETAHFYDQVEQYGQDPYHTADDFQVLAEAFYRASERLHRGRVDKRVQRDFRRLGRTFDDLAYYYDGAEQGVDRRHGVRRDGYYDGRNRPRVRARVEYGRRGGVRFDVGVRLPGGRLRVSGR